MPTLSEFLYKKFQVVFMIFDGAEATSKRLIQRFKDFWAIKTKVVKRLFSQ